MNLIIVFFFFFFQGLIGKSVVEKLLRSCPGIKKIYLLLRTKHGKNSNERLEEMKKGQVKKIY